MLHNFTIYWVKMNFLLFVLDLMLNAPPSGVMRNSKEVCKSYQKATHTCYKQPQAKCTEDIQVSPNHKVPYYITGRAPRQTAQSLSWLQAALV